MRKWKADDGWDRGRFQGEVLGWVMMTALIVILTAGKGAIPQITGKWKFVVDALKLADKTGDLGTYLGAAGKLPGKAAEIVRSKLGRPAGQAAEGVEEAAVKAGKEGAEIVSEIPVQLGKEAHSVKVVKVAGRKQIWLCSDHCGEIIKKIDEISGNMTAAGRNELEALKKQAQAVEESINKGEIPADRIESETKKLSDRLAEISQNPLFGWQYYSLAGTYKAGGRATNVLRLIPEDWAHILEGHVKATFNPAKRAGAPVSTVFKGTPKQYLEILQEAVENQAVIRELKESNGNIVAIVRNQEWVLQIDVPTGAIKTFHARRPITNKRLFEVITGS